MLQITFGIYIFVFIFILLIGLMFSSDNIDNNKNTYITTYSDCDTYSNVQQIIITHNNIEYTFDFVDTNANIKINVVKNRTDNDSKIITIYKIIRGKSNYE